MKSYFTQNKLIYNITPFLVIGICLVILSIHTLITDGSGWGGVAAIAMLIFALILFIIDFGFKKIIKKYDRILIIEFVIGIIVLAGII
ncbi:MAG: hypothetical protein JXR05_10715 [Flavobacteriaceae bacterium]